MLTIGEGTHYCRYCGYDMKAREDRLCPSCDGDPCEAKRYAALRELRADHPRMVAAKARWDGGGCRHRPRCATFRAHVQRSR